jgi:spore maturation protein CgeB
MANVLYIGDDLPHTTSAHRAHALARLGHSVIIRSPYKEVRKYLQSRFMGAIHYRTGYSLLQNSIYNWIEQMKSQVKKLDLIWVDSGELLGPGCLLSLKEMKCPIILYNIDDPTGKRDGRRFYSLKKSLPLYDLVAVVRKETEEECLEFGAKRVVRVLRSYDEKDHQPFTEISEIPVKFRSEVAFIGTWMKNEKRDDFLLTLIKQNVPISIWGNLWEKSSIWKLLQPYYRGAAIYGRDYVAAIQGAKLCIGLLSKGNRDQHTQRSLEVPFAGGILCAERTPEHLAMYQEGVEAVFWSNATECATICEQLLKDDQYREEIRLAGMKRVKNLKVGNEDVCRTILNDLLQIDSKPGVSVPMIV